MSDLNVSNANLEVQWILIHREHCKNVLVGNEYRPPNGHLTKAIKCLNDCIKTVNLGNTDILILGDMNVNLKKVSFFC